MSGSSDMIIKEQFSDPRFQREKLVFPVKEEILQQASLSGSNLIASTPKAQQG